MRWVRICRGAHVQFLTGVLQGGEKAKESLREDKYLLGYLRCWPEMVISLPPSFFLCFSSRKGHCLAYAGSELWNAWYTPRQEAFSRTAF